MNPNNSRLLKPSENEKALRVEDIDEHLNTTVVIKPNE